MVGNKCCKNTTLGNHCAASQGAVRGSPHKITAHGEIHNLENDFKFRMKYFRVWSREGDVKVSQSVVGDVRVS